MQTITISNREFMICDVPEGASDFMIPVINILDPRIVSFDDTGKIIDVQVLSKGNYKIISRVLELDEGFCKTLFSGEICSPEINDGFITAKEKCISLLQSKGIDADNKLLIEKVK